ncbi:MAG: TIM barrel protein [SAR202 cluster bacterium]|mgnify:FL=1|nr:TIM barrel protein [SAR202 cluster bacterium]|tara:strand:+ start:36955 stop:37845 length:891 start_codon:yes stop_codon:yes gene_type:complete
MVIKIGTGPDSWGISGPNNPSQIDWKQCISEIAQAGYEYTELGPIGYFPTDPILLKEELAKVNLKLSAVTVMAGHLDSIADWKDIHTALLKTGELGAELNALYIVLIDDFYRDWHTGLNKTEEILNDDQWKIFIENSQLFSQKAKEYYNLKTVFHPHAETHIETESHIEKFLECTDPNLISLLLDTGHHAYRGGDPISFFEKYHHRIPYIHLKNVNLKILSEIKDKKSAMIEAVSKKVFCEPYKGTIDISNFSKSVKKHNYNGVITVEQDMYKPDHDVPLKIAMKTRHYLSEIGLG